MMKLKKLFLTMGALLTCATAQAYTEPCPGEFGLAVEWLYLLPNIDRPYYAVSETLVGSTEIDAKRIANCPSWQSGYRIEGVYSFCDCDYDVRLRWTHLPSFCSNDTFEGTGFSPINVFSDAEPGSITSKLDMEFYYLDLLFGKNVYDCCCLSLDLQFGLQYAYSKFDERILIVNNNISFGGTGEGHHKSTLHGIGPEVAFNFVYDLCGCLDLVGRGNAALLASTRDVEDFDSARSTLLTGSGTSKSDSCWEVIPAGGLRLGLHYGSSWGMGGGCCNTCCFNFDIEVGYEFIYYHHFMDRQFLEEDMFLNFSAHGPYVHVGVTF